MSAQVHTTPDRIAYPSHPQYHRLPQEMSKMKQQKTHPPFAITDRVVVVQDAEDGMFLNGLHGTVVGVTFTTDPEDPFGPWVVAVGIDGMKLDNILKFSATELVHETEPAVKTSLQAVVTQPEDEEAFAAHGEIPDVQEWIQRAREIQHESLDRNTPVFDQVVQDALAVDGFAESVEADLAAWTDGAR